MPPRASTRLFSALTFFVLMFVLATGCGPADPIECVGDDCEDPCVGDDCEEPCVGDDCEEPCVGDDCEEPCVGDDCEEPCVGDDCEDDDPCNPNPCTDEAGNRTRCLWDGQGGFDCHCDAGYRESGGLCCQPFSSASGGACVCNQGYVEDDSGACVEVCSEDSIGGLGGWCPPGEICVQGTCRVDRCIDYSCPERSSCVLRDDGPFCLCEAGLQMSSGRCCPINSTNRDGTCVCDEGFVDSAGECVPDPNNPCHPSNPCSEAGLHKNTCVVDSSVTGGYRCECNQGYAESDGSCVLAVWDICPEGLVCRAEVCVPPLLTDEQCLTDEDCREFDPNAPTYCNASAAGGICLGCTHHSDCPGNSQCTSFATCALLCSSDSDCPYGKCYLSTGYCGQAPCTSNADCFNGTVCIDTGGDGRGWCQRIPCVETECSHTFPNGTCPNPGEACLYGECYASCEPNPCTQEPNKTVCTTEGGQPVCECEAGYSLDEQGRCLPDPSDCPDGFACERGYCVDRREPYFVCATDADCGSGLTCSPTLPAGRCQGCGAGAPCPSGLDCLATYCLQPCSSHAQCHPGMVCAGSGYCGRKDCGGSADCPEGYACVSGASGGTCNRVTCEDG